MTLKDPFQLELFYNSVLSVFPALVQAWLWHQARLPAVTNPKATGRVGT